MSAVPTIPEIGLIADDADAACLLRPPRPAIMRALRQPGSAASVARSLNMPRQQLAYHVRALEQQGLLRHVGDRRVGNCTERLLVASAQRYLISTSVLQDLGIDKDAASDLFSSAYLVGTAQAAAEEVTAMRHAADLAGQKLATLTLETEVSFADPAQQQEFAKELQRTVAALTRKYQATTAQSRSFHLALLAYPSLAGAEDEPE